MHTAFMCASGFMQRDIDDEISKKECHNHGMEPTFYTAAHARFKKINHE